MIFWATSSWCSLNIEYLDGGSKAAMSAPSSYIKFWATSTWCTSKDHIFHVGKVFKHQNYILFLKNGRKWIFCFAPFHIGALCSKTLGRFRQSLEWSYQKNFCIFPNIIFQKILNLAKEVANYQFCHLLHKNESPYSL